MSEEFGATIDDVVEKKEGKYRRTEFIDLKAGEHRIRILEPMETKQYAHYVGYSWLKCLADECPICENNKKILYEHPEDYRDVKGWNPRRDRYYINVLDKTTARVCTKCGTEKKDAEASTCPACNSPMAEPAPLNKVKVLSRGKTLFEDLKVISKSIRDEDDKRIDIRTYDWRLVVRGVKKDTVISPIPLYTPGKTDNPVYEGELFPLDNATIELTREEMLDVFNGASVKDIFTMRRAKKQISDADFFKPDDKKDVEESIDSIFSA